MSRQITQPVNQVRFTNVAIVRMNKCGKRFEIACYRNKITNYRQGVETDLSEVLQTERIFSNVSKGKEAKTSDLEKAFGKSTSTEEICHTILMKGEYQVSDLERNASYNNRYKEIATMIQEKCVNKETNRRYTISVISEAMKKAEFSVHPTRSSKQQFLDAVKMIQKKNVLPNLERAKMLLCVSTSNDLYQIDDIMNHFDNIETNHIIEYPKKDTHRIEMLIDPSLFRPIESIVKDNSGYFLEILQQVVTLDQDCTIEQELNIANKAIAKDAEHISLKNLSIQENDTNTSLPVSNDDDNHHSTKIEEEPNEELDESEEEIIPMTNKQNKKAMKKSKKAKRREKVDEAERQQRIDIEKQRLEERRVACETATTNTVSTNTSDNTNSNMKSCNTCGGSFTPNEYRIHFKSDWHRFNLQLKMKGVPVVSEKEFLMCDANILFD